MTLGLFLVTGRGDAANPGDITGPSLTGADASAGFAHPVVAGLLSDAGALAVVAEAPMIGFVIDNTASMPQSLPGIRTGINALMDCVPSFQGTIPPNFLVMTMNDPTISDPVIYDNPGQVRSWAMGILATGGGDCPEPAMAALLRAIGGATPNAAIFLFTDASARDCEKSLLVVEAARTKNIKIFTVRTGDCVTFSSPQVGGSTPPEDFTRDRVSPTGRGGESTPLESQLIGSAACDDAFFDVAFLTGGMEILATNLDVGATLDAGKSFLDATVSLSAAIDGLLTSGVNSRTFPIDSSVQRVDFVIRMNQKQAIVIRQPNGTAVNLLGAGVHTRSFDTGQVTSIQSPAPGDWTVEMTGSGLFNIDVLVKSPIALTKFTFVTVSGSVSNRSYTPIRQTTRNSGTLNAILGYQGVALPGGTRFVNDAGGLVINVPIATSSNLGTNERLATISNVSEPFRAEIFGTDGGGFTWRRVSPMFYQPTDLVMTASNVPAQMNANGIYQFNVTVQNVGVTRTFDFTADATLRMDFVTVTPAAAVIAGGGAQLLTIRVGVPLDNDVTAVTDFLVSARQSNGAGNALAVPILVIENLPPDCSGAYTYGIDTSYQTYELEPLLFGGIIDPEGQPVFVEMLEAFQDEPLEYNTGANANATCPDAIHTGGVNYLRNESATSGNGRVYSGTYVASDPQGKTCTGAFTYCIPRRHGRAETCTDDGQHYDATGVCTRFEFGTTLEPTVDEPAISVVPSTPSRMVLKLSGVEAGPVRVRVFDISGRVVETVWEGASADHELDVVWDTSKLGSGIYFVRAEAGSRTLVRKVVVAR